MSKTSGESYDYSTSLLNSANLTVWLHRHRAVIVVVLLFLLIIILSPLWIFWLDPADGVNWADTVEHVFTAVGILGAGCALVGWLLARADRRTDLLISLHAQFGTAEIIKGKAIIDQEPAVIGNDQRDDIDRLLSFYVLICGVRASGEVPEKSLSICFRYWLTHYYRNFFETDPVTGQTKPKPNGLRDYINLHYPTVRTWLLDDIQKPARSKSFFRPHEFWGTAIETDPKKLWP